MNIRRIIFVLTTLLIIVLAGLSYQYFVLQRTSTKLEETYQRNALSLALAQEAIVTSDELTRAARTFVSTGDAKYERQYNSIAAIRAGFHERPQAYPRVYWNYYNADQKSPRPDSGVKKSLVKLVEEAGFTTEEVDLLKQSIANSQQLGKREIRAFNMLKGKYENSSGDYAVLNTPKPEEARQLVFGLEYQIQKLGIMEPLDRFFDIVEQRVNQNLETVIGDQDTSRLIFAILLVVALILIIAIVLLIREDNRRRLAERQAAQEKAEAENEQLNDSVINILEAVHSLSQRDLTVKAPVTTDVIGTVSDSINSLTDETAKVLSGVTNIAGEVADVSANVKSQADQVSATAEIERGNVQAMTEALFTATQTMNRVAALAEQSNESAGQATEVTEQALETVNGTVNDMESIRETISETEKRIKRLGERSQEISGIVNLINTISERTHALALNASMQAAVAGEAGRGFAVVAEEVQRLAESSRNATEQIATLVGNIQVETNETINTVNHTISQVVEGSEQAQKAGEQMRRTQEITTQLVEQVRSIAGASEEQKAMSAQLLEAVQNIGESTEKTAQQIEAQNQGTAALQQAATNLIESVNVFKLPDGSTAS